jgi:arsenite methyltransferase
MAELTATSTSQCCAPAAQETCCEPSEKAACCETSAAGAACGCAAGQSAEAESGAGSAIVRGPKPR